ncbi:MAG TPA: hypothetical protein VMR37_05185 [Rhabdochlamydiaceae bacterium]|jgi:hypothetical protein|nr:hypothetical protein [Rhabdochlamydiaceae bacterium]
MVDFSIKALTAPFVPQAQRCFAKTARYVARKHPGISLNEIEYDLKALMFDTTSTMIVTTVALAYFKTIALVTAAALIVFFYLVRRIIDQTITPLQPQENTQSVLAHIKTFIATVCSRAPAEPPASKKTVREKIKATFHQGNDIVIGTVVLFKLPHHPLPHVISMVFTRSS